MGIKYEVVAAGEKYQDKDGNEKTRWVKMGVVLERNDGSLSLKIESIPVGFTGWANLWTPQPKEQRPAQDRQAQERLQTRGQKALEEMPDDIPF